jgi:outer membrane protein assembly factor BamB
MGYQDGQDVVYCFDAVSGTEVWSTSYPCEIHDSDDTGGPASTPLVRDGKVYTLSRNGDVYCFESDTGKVVWSRHLYEEFSPKKPTFGFTASPRCQGDLLIIDVGIVFALNKEDGKTVWKTRDYVATCSTPQLLSYQGNDLVAAFNKVGLVLLKLETGEESSIKPWTTPNWNTNTGTPLVQGDKVFISSGFDGGCGLLQLQGTDEPKTLWTNEEIRTRNSIPVFWEGYLYTFNKEVMTCIEFETGKIRWESRFADKGSITIAGGKLLILNEKGELILSEPDPTGFKDLGRSQNIGPTCWSIPVLCNQRIYLRNSRGQLVCLDVTPK